MFKNKFFLSLIVLICSAPVALFSQIQLSQTVIGSAGQYASASNLNLSYTVGEPVIHTLANGNFMLTQGFHQPITSTTISQLTITISGINASNQCTNDGSAEVTVTGGVAPYTYIWDNHNSADSSITELSGGVYGVTVIDLFGNTGTASFEIQAEQSTDCKLIIYSGITPNNDGINDQWIIDRIDLYPSNQVNIFNRWGENVWSGTQYDNMNVVWSGESKFGGVLPAGAYFYVVEADALENDETGWVQITR